MFSVDSVERKFMKSSVEAPVAQASFIQLHNELKPELTSQWLEEEQRAQDLRLEDVEALDIYEAKAKRGSVMMVHSKWVRLDPICQRPRRPRSNCTSHRVSTRGRLEAHPGYLRELSSRSNSMSLDL